MNARFLPVLTPRARTAPSRRPRAARRAGFWRTATLASAALAILAACGGSPQPGELSPSKTKPSKTTTSRPATPDRTATRTPGPTSTTQSPPPTGHTKSPKAAVKAAVRHYYAAYDKAANSGDESFFQDVAQPDCNCRLPKAAKEIWENGGHVEGFRYVIDDQHVEALGPAAAKATVTTHVPKHTYYESAGARPKSGSDSGATFTVSLARVHGVWIVTYVQPEG